MKKQIKPIIFISFVIIYLEIIFKVLILKNIGIYDVLYTILFSIPSILLINIICNIFKEKPAKIIMIVISSFITLYFLIQVVFFKLFSVPFSFSTIGLAENALDFTDIIVNAVKSYFIYIVAFVVPLILFIPIRNKITFERYSIKKILIMTGVLILIFAVSIGIVNIDKKDIYSPYNLYYKIDAPEKNIKMFGLLTATRIDIKRTVLGFEDNLIIQASNTAEEEPQNIEYGYNELEIDFEQLKSSTSDKNLSSAFEYIENTVLF